MKTCFDVWADVRSLIQVPQLLQHIDGDIWEHTMPPARKKTDILINSFNITNQWMQQSIVNINIHAPGLELLQGNIIVLTADRERLHFLSSIIVSLVDYQYKKDFFTTIDRPPVIRKDNDGTWFCNTRVLWRSIQTNFKNI
jgi:hypothetical protein